MLSLRLRKSDRGDGTYQLSFMRFDKRNVPGVRAYIFLEPDELAQLSYYIQQLESEVDALEHHSVPFLEERIDTIKH
jgi:hypothetical protein